MNPNKKLVNSNNTFWSNNMLRMV